MLILGYKCPYCKRKFKTDDKVHERTCRKESKEFNILHAKYIKLKPKLMKDIFNNVINDPEVLEWVSSILQLKKDIDTYRFKITEKYGDWSKVDYENEQLWKEYCKLPKFYENEIKIDKMIRLCVNKVITLSTKSYKIRDHILNLENHIFWTMRDKIFKYFKINKWLE